MAKKTFNREWSYSVQWGYLKFVFRFPAASLSTLLVPPIIAVNLSGNPRLRNAAISIFVVLWLFIFHYESTRIFYLNAATQSELPKFKFLFPPAGWIMFFNVDDTYSHGEVYGKMGESVHSIDPHDIFRTRTFGFDNIHRNVLSAVGPGRTPQRFVSISRGGYRPTKILS